MAVGRFQVMAMLQAARAYVLGLSLESAKSWGLNRAIFYAAAKRGFQKKPAPMRFEEIKLPTKVLEEKEIKEVQDTFNIHQLGDEYAYSVELEGKKFFVIGNEIQTPERFEKQIGTRFGPCFEDAWAEAIDICRKSDQGILLSQRYFYELIYKPRRDELALKWTEMVDETEK